MSIITKITANLSKAEVVKILTEAVEKETFRKVIKLDFKAGSRIVGQRDEYSENYFDGVDVVLGEMIDISQSDWAKRNAKENALDAREGAH